jgi:hypothetical protein
MPRNINLQGEMIMACPIKDSCTFFNNQMRMMEERKKTIKIRFCLSSYGQCARYKVYEHYKTVQKVSPDLYPNDFERADEIIRKNQIHVRHKPTGRYKKHH